MELTDPNTSSTSTGDVTGTRFYTFGGATVAVRTAQGLSLLLGDEQGSAQIMMPLHTDSNGALLPATQADADATERTAYAPYGARRGEDLEDINRGWLGQVEDKGTGLTYLNARYYDPALGRFLSPDPLMNPGDPRTLDPYRYADNNPIVYTDATGLRPDCSGLTGDSYKECMKPPSGAGGQTPVTSAGDPRSWSKPPLPTNPYADHMTKAYEKLKLAVAIVGTTAAALKAIADQASELARALRRGESIGSRLADYRWDRNPLLHTLAELGRNPFIRAVAEILGGQAADLIQVVLDTISHYIGTYDFIEAEGDRWTESFVTSMVSASAGIVVESSTDQMVATGCVATGGLACGGLVVAQGLVSWGVEDYATRQYINDVRCRYGVGCFESTPSPGPEPQPPVVKAKALIRPS